MQLIQDKKQTIFLVACNERQTIKLFETFTDSDSVIDKICNVVKNLILRK